MPARTTPIARRLFASSTVAGAVRLSTPITCGISMIFAIQSKKSSRCGERAMGAINALLGPCSLDGVGKRHKPELWPKAPGHQRLLHDIQDDPAPAAFGNRQWPDVGGEDRDDARSRRDGPACCASGRTDEQGTSVHHAFLHSALSPTSP